jgi:hypothetical protein
VKGWNDKTTYRNKFQVFLVNYLRIWDQSQKTKSSFTVCIAQRRKYSLRILVQETFSSKNFALFFFSRESFLKSRENLAQIFPLHQKKGKFIDDFSAPSPFDTLQLLLTCLIEITLRRKQYLLGFSIDVKSQSQNVFSRGTWRGSYQMNLPFIDFPNLAWNYFSIGINESLKHRREFLEKRDEKLFLFQYSFRGSFKGKRS